MDIPQVIADLGDLKELRPECHQEPNPHNGQVDRLAPLHRGKDLIFLMDHKVHQALLVHQGKRDKKEIQDLSVTLGLLECPGVLEEREKKDILEGME